MTVTYCNLNDFSRYTKGAGVINDYKLETDSVSEYGIELRNDSTLNTSDRAYITLQLPNIRIFDKITFKFKIRGTGKIYVGLEDNSGSRFQIDWVELKNKEHYVTFTYEGVKNATHVLALGGIGNHFIDCIITDLQVMVNNKYVNKGRKELCGTIQSNGGNEFKVRNDLGIDTIESVVGSVNTITVKFYERIVKQGVAFGNIRAYGRGDDYIVKVNPIDKNTVEVKLYTPNSSTPVNTDTIPQYVYIDILYKC